MVLLLAFEFIRYHFQTLDFSPNDLNDKGRIVGDIQTVRTNGIDTEPVLLIDGREVKLGEYARTGSAFTINNQDHILIVCEARTLKASKIQDHKAVEAGPFKDRACFFWANSKATYVGSYYSVKRLLNNDRILVTQYDVPAHPRYQIVTIKDRQTKRSAAPTVPPRGKEYIANTGFSEMNELGTLVGYSFSHG